MCRISALGCALFDHENKLICLHTRLTDSSKNASYTLNQFNILVDKDERNARLSYVARYEIYGGLRCCCHNRDNLKYVCSVWSSSIEIAKLKLSQSLSERESWLPGVKLEMTQHTRAASMRLSDLLYDCVGKRCQPAVTVVCMSLEVSREKWHVNKSVANKLKGSCTTRGHIPH